MSRASRRLVGLAWLTLFAVSWSPSSADAAMPGANGRIAFAVELYAPGSDAAGDYWVTTVRPNGSRPRQFDVLAYGPVAYSPRGGRLAYAPAFAEGIRVLNLFGRRHNRRVTVPENPADCPPFESPPIDDSPDWSPTGRRIVFTRQTYCGAGGDRTELWIHYGGGERRLTDGASASWSVNGDIAFAGADGHIYTIRPDGSALRRVSSSRCSDPDWSPDGRQIVCVAGSDIATMRADGSAFRRLTHGRDRDAGPVFSPNGRRLAFVRNDASIMTIGRTGARMRRVARRVSNDPDFEFVVYPPDWQPR